MHTGIPRKISPSSASASVFKSVLNKSSTSTASRLPISRLPTSSKKSAGASSRSLKENVLPVSSKKQGSVRSITLEKSSHDANEHKIEKKNNNTGADLGDVRSVGSKRKASIAFIHFCVVLGLTTMKDEEEEISFAYPMLADPCSEIVEADENSVRINFDCNVTDNDREHDILKLESSLYETRLAARHNDSIQVTLKRRQARILRRMDRVADDDEISISLDYIPESDIEGILGVEYIIDDDDEEEADVTFDLSDFLNKNPAPVAPLPAVPAPHAPAPVAAEEADDTFDLSDFLNKHAPIEREERLTDTSLSELMQVEIDYDREFPNTAIGRPPHIFVCRYKRDMKRKAAAQKALEESAACVQKNRCVLENEYNVDIPLQNWAPTLSGSVLSPKLHSVPSIPSLIVTSPSDGDLECVAGSGPTVEFDDELMASGSYKDFLLDSSFHNWTMRFGTLLPNEVNMDEDEEYQQTPEMLITNPDVPQIIVTSPSDGDISFDNTLLERLLLEYDEAGLLD